MPPSASDDPSATPAYDDPSATGFPWRLEDVLTRAGRLALDELLALAAPPMCAACRSALSRSEGLLCVTCARSLPWLPRAGCPRCGLPRHPGRGCPAASASFERTWAPLAYEGVARKLVAALKFQAALPVAELMAAQIAANLPRDLRELRRTVIVGVPPQEARLRRRGFDPTAYLAAAFARRAGLTSLVCLRRRDRATPQVGASTAQRRAADRLRIEVVGASPPLVFLVDDVHTTGATLEACARALRDAGAQRVIAITYARTL